MPLDAGEVPQRQPAPRRGEVDLWDSRTGSERSGRQGSLTSGKHPSGAQRIFGLGLRAPKKELIYLCELCETCVNTFQNDVTPAFYKALYEFGRSARLAVHQYCFGPTFLM